MKTAMKIAFISLLFIASVIARSATKINQSAQASLIPIKEAERVLYFNHYRVYQREDGVTLVCPFACEASWKLHKKGECVSSSSRFAWVDVNTLNIPGYEISGLAFYVDAYNSVIELQVFFRKRQLNQNR